MITRKQGISFSLATVALCISQLASSATCSCAGVTLSNSIDLASFSSDQLQVSFNYTNIDISDLVDGNKVIKDETGRFRETNSYIVQATYGINEHWAIVGIVSQIEHRRNIAISDTSVESSSGMGDSMLVLSYSPKKIDPFSRNEWAVGLGARIPTGENNNGDPIVFAEDLQPGQGAWGESLWLHYAHSFNQKANWIVFADANYAHTGKNDRQYSFTNEWNVSSGVKYTAGDQWNGSLSFNYRKADPHTRFGANFPNTGGNWLDFSPSLQYSFNQNTSIGFSATLPVRRSLKGTLQFTTKRSYTLSISHSFDLK